MLAVRFDGDIIQIVVVLAIVAGSAILRGVKKAMDRRRDEMDAARHPHPPAKIAARPPEGGDRPGAPPLPTDDSSFQQSVASSEAGQPRDRAGEMSPDEWDPAHWREARLRGKTAAAQAWAGKQVEEAKARRMWQRQQAMAQIKAEARAIATYMKERVAEATQDDNLIEIAPPAAPPTPPPQSRRATAPVRRPPQPRKPAPPREPAAQPAEEQTHMLVAGGTDHVFAHHEDISHTEIGSERENAHAQARRIALPWGRGPDLERAILYHEILSPPLALRQETANRF
jgi:hypothetical protein